MSKERTVLLRTTSFSAKAGEAVVSAPPGDCPSDEQEQRVGGRRGIGFRRLRIARRDADYTRALASKTPRRRAAISTGLDQTSAPALRCVKDEATVVNLIAATTTSCRLEVYAGPDDGTYADKIRLPDRGIRAVDLHADQFPPECNYTINPNR